MMAVDDQVKSMSSNSQVNSGVTKPGSGELAEQDMMKCFTETNRELKITETLFSHIERLAKIGAWNLDLVTGMMTGSNEIYRLYELPIGTKIDRDLAVSAYRGATRATLDKAVGDAIKHGRPFDLTVPFVTVSGRERWVRLLGSAEIDKGITVNLFGTIQDVTEERERQEEMRRLALTDQLTGLANRYAFQETANEQIRTCRDNGLFSAVCIVDLNRFKEINDHLGHEAGDHVLKSIAQWLETSLDTANMVSRLGGDEFAIVTTGKDSVEAVYRELETILASTEQTFEYQGRTIPVSVSMGIAIFPEDGSDVQQLTKHADLALYAVKAEGKRRVRRFEAPMSIAFTRRITVLSEFRRAIENGEIVPYYQPVVDLKTERVSGFEALARWNHPEKGVLLPGAFSDIFENGPICEALGRNMLKRITSDMKSWKADGIDFVRIGFNVEKAELKQDDFAQSVLDEIESAGLDHCNLIVEFTENSGFGDDRTVVEQLARLRSAGVRVALDDFGTGFSSLTHLQKLPFDILKIDRSFIHDISNSPTNLAIVKALVTLGKELGYSIVAEGIENSQQQDLLWRLGCDRGQGFLFSKAIPAAELPDCVRRSVNSKSSSSTWSGVTAA